MTGTVINLQNRLAAHLRAHTPPLPQPADTTTTPVTPLPPARPLTVQRLAALIREALPLGVTFHLQGPCLTILGRAKLPEPLIKLLNDFERTGWLHGYFGCDRVDAEAIALLARLHVQAHLIEDTRRLRRALQRLNDDVRNNGPEIGFDIETAADPKHRKLPPPVKFTAEGVIAERQGAADNLKDNTLLDPHRSHIAAAQFYAGGEHAFVVRGHALRVLLRSAWFRRQRFVAHNAVMELSFLDHFFSRPGRRPLIGPAIECSMQMTGLTIGSRRSALGGRSLANAAKVIGKIEVGKDLATSDWDAPELTPGQTSYAAADSVLAYKLHRKLRPVLQRPLDHGQSRWTAYELQRDAGPSVARMQNRGLRLDPEEHARQAKDWARDLAIARHAYVDATGQDPPSTDTEVRAWLETVLTPEQQNTWLRTKDGKLSINQIELARVREEPNAKTIIAIRELKTMVQSFGPRLAKHIHPVTGRIHGSFSIAAAASGRFSAADPNLQQLPVRRFPRFRECVIAAPGCVLIVADYGQVELRAWAWLYQDETLMAELVNGDIHRRTAAQVNGITLEEVTAAQRYAAKAINFGTIYGITAEGLCRSIFANYGIELSILKAHRALDTFATTYSRAWSGRARFAKECRALGYIYIPTSGRIFRREWYGYEYLSDRQAFNLPVQGSCADAMLRAMPLIDNLLREGQIRGGLIASVHDELLLEVDERDAEIARVLLEDGMTAAFADTFPGAPTQGVVKAVICKNWAEAK